MPSPSSLTMMMPMNDEDVELQSIDSPPISAESNDHIVTESSSHEAKSPDPLLPLQKEDNFTNEFPGDTSSTTEQSENDNFLTMYGSGVIGMLERIPLPIKLVVLCLFSIAAMITFVVLTLVYTGEATRMAIDHRDTISYLNTMNEYIISLQDERLSTTMYLTANQSKPAEYHGAAQYYEHTIAVTVSKKRLVDSRTGNLRGKMSDDKRRKMDPYFQILRQQDPVLEQHRQRVKQRLVDPFQNIAFFRNFFDDALLFQTALLDVADLSYRTTEYLFVSRIMEAIEKLKAGVLNVVATGGNVATVLRWVAYRTEYETFEKLFLAPKGYATLDHFFGDMDLPPNIQLIANLTEAHEIIQAALVNSGGAVADGKNDERLLLYVNDLNPRISILRDVGVSILNVELRKAKQKGVESIASIVVYCVIAFLFGVLSILSAFVLSGTIIAPWKRLNNIQEAAIAKFVPRAFLHLLGCRRITDVQLGMHVKKNDLTIMEMEVLNFDLVSQRMSDEEVFALLNRYLSFVGPLVRKYDGFIQSYAGDKCIALFTNSEKAVKASMDIQEMLYTFNADQTVDIKLGTRIHCDSALIGTLGENEKIDGAILSPSYSSIKNTLARITSKLKAKTLVTNRVFEQKRAQQKYQTRKIGVVATQQAQPHHHNQLSYNDGTASTAPATTTTTVIDVYEVLHPTGDVSKIAHKHLFGDALTSFLQGRYRDALTLFARVRDQSSSDVDDVTETYLQRATELEKRTKLVVQSLQMSDVLGDVVLREAFEQFCTAERSSENISVWKEIENYKSIVDGDERLQHAKMIFDTYLSLNGRCTVNVNEAMKHEVLQKINAHPTVLLDHMLFDRVKRDLELLMSTDTLARFKTSHQFETHFVRSSFGVRPLSLDEI